MQDPINRPFVFPGTGPDEFRIRIVVAGPTSSIARIP